MKFQKSIIRWVLACGVLVNGVLIAQTPTEPAIPAGEDFVPPINTDIFPSAPTAASLGKYGTYEVGHYTGVPNISIPLFTVPGRNIQIPLSLSYHASGIKVEERASWVGMGWSLIAGGSITRTVKGLPDEMEIRDGYNNVVSSGYFSDPEHITKMEDISPILESDLKFLDEVTKGQWDTSPDIFSFNFLGYSGKFIYDRNGFPRLIDHQNMEIIRVDENEFQITTPDGVIYRFGRDSNGATAIDVSSMHGSWLGPIGSGNISAWHLTEILHPNGIDNIKLFYDHTMTVATTTTTHTKLVARIGRSSSHISKPIQKSTASSTNTVMLLSKIEFPGGTIEFVKDEDNSREDLPQGFRLKDIIVKDKLGEPIRFIELVTDYYNKNAAGDSWKMKRLRLDQVKFYAADDKNEKSKEFHDYSFEYNGETPAYNSVGQDHWGYFTGEMGNFDNGGNMIPEVGQSGETGYLPGLDRETKEMYLLRGILNKITYPTKGYTKFEYEANEVLETEAVNQVEHEYKVSSKGSSSSFDFGSSDLSAMQTNLLNLMTTDFLEDKCGSTIICGNAATFDECYNTCLSGRSSQKFQLHPNASTSVVLNIQAVSKSKKTIIDGRPNFSIPIWGVYNHTDGVWLSTTQFNDMPSDGSNDDLNTDDDKVEKEEVLTLQHGKEYEVIVYCCNNSELFAELSVKQSVSVSQTNWYNRQVGGARIRRIASYDEGGTEAVFEKNYTYTKEAATNEIEEKSSGIFRGKEPTYVYDYKTATPITIPGAFGTAYRIDEYKARTARSLTSVENGSVVGYSRVTEIFGKASENTGKIVYEYKQGDVLAGKLSAKSIYRLLSNGEYELVSKTEYEYDESKIGIDAPFSREIKGFEVKRALTSIGLYDLYENIELRSQTFEYPATTVKTAWVPLIKETNTIYKHNVSPGGNTIVSDYTTIKEYTYGNYRHALPTQVMTIAPDGARKKVIYKYPHDYTFDGCDIDTWNCKPKDRYKSCYETYRICEQNKSITCESLKTTFLNKELQMEIDFANCKMTGGEGVFETCLKVKEDFYNTEVKSARIAWETCLTTNECFNDLKECLNTVDETVCTATFESCQWENYNSSDDFLKTVIQMQRHNLANRLIEQEVWFQPAGGVMTLQGAYRIEYAKEKQLLVEGSGQLAEVPVQLGRDYRILPSKVYRYIDQSGTGVFTPSSIQTDNGTHSISFDEDYELMLTYDKYDQYGNLRQYTPAHSTTNSIQWGAEGMVSVAAIANARVSDDVRGGEFSFLGFEDDYSSIVGNDYWTLQVANELLEDAHSGTYSCKVRYGDWGPTRWFVPDNQSTRYVLSAWVKTEAGFGSNQGELVFRTIKGDGATGDTYPSTPSSNVSLKFGDTEGKWKYMETIIDLEQIRSDGQLLASDELWIYAGIKNDDGAYDFLVDDVQFRPYLSTIQTANIDLLEGVESINDQYGNTLYYRYDDFGRLQKALDDRNHVLAKYKYHYSTSN